MPVLYDGWTEPPERTEERYRDKLQERLDWLAEQECNCKMSVLEPWKVVSLCDRCREINEIEEALGYEPPF